jgi:hypothetical protein
MDFILLAEHYAGDDHNVKTLASGVLAGYAGVSVEDFEARAARRGNTNGTSRDFSQHPHKPVLRLLVLHDDADREFGYTTGAEQALEQAGEDNWTVVSIKNDWATVVQP